MNTLDPSQKAAVLIEALSYLRRFRHQTIVIKLGGSTMDAPQAVRSLLEDIVFLQTAGLRPVVVHGGGKAIDRRVTDAVEARGEDRGAWLKLRHARGVVE